MKDRRRPTEGGPTTGSTANKLIRAVIVLVFMVTMGRMVYHVFEPVRMPIDLIQIWIAGKVWAAGIPPYSEAYEQFSREQLDIVYTATWYYPPNWFPISVIIGRLPPYPARIAWGFGNMVMMITGCLAIAKVLDPTSRLSRFYLAMSVTAAVALHQATSTVFFLGQTSLIPFCGLSLVLLSHRTKSVGWGAVGLTLLMLKPQMGAPLLGFMLINRELRRSALIGLVITLVLCLMGSYPAGPLETARGFLQCAANLEDHPSNTHETLCGLSHLFVLGTGVQLKATWMVIAAMLVTGAAAGFIRTRREVDSRRELELFLIAVASVCFLVPLKYYDFVFSIPMLGCLPYVRRLAAASTGLFLLATWRANNVVAIFGEPGQQTTAYLSAWTLWLFLSLILIFFSSSPTPESSSQEAINTPKRQTA